LIENRLANNAVLREKTMALFMGVIVMQYG